MTDRAPLAVVPAEGLWCLAPQTALRFSPNGEVHTCCVNSTFALGRVDHDRLSDIWQGPQTTRLTEALAVGDGSLGCQDCEFEHVRGRREVTHAEQYDRYVDNPTPAWPRRLEFAMSNTCNLMCIHCNGELSSAIRRKREHLPPIPDLYGEQFFSEIGAFLEHAEVTTFLGGEPFLARPARRIWDLMIDLGVRPEVHVTTNGTVWNDEVERYLRELRMNVAISIDGVRRDTFERIREGADFDEVMATRDRMFAMTQSYGAAFMINHCLMKDNVHELYDLLLDADARDMNVHVIPVTYPLHLGVFDLQRDALQAVVDDLEATGAARGPLGRNHGQWTTALAHLRNFTSEIDAAEATASGFPVGTPRRRRGGVALSEQRRALTEHCGGDLLEVLTRAEVVADVVVPAWAAVLEPSSWIGAPATTLVGRMAASLGGEPIVELSHPSRDVTLVEVSVVAPGGTTTLRVAVVDSHSEDATERVALVSCPELAGAPIER